MTLYQATMGPTTLGIGAAVVNAAQVYDSDNPVTSGVAQAANVTIIKQIIVCNTDGSAARTFSLYLDSNGTVAVGDTLFEGVTLAAGETKIINTSLVLRAAQNHKLHARASANSVVVLTWVGIEEY